MIERKIQELHTAIQLYKHDDFITFRVFAQKKPFQKHLQWVHSIYDIQIQIVPPFACLMDMRPIRNFTSKKEAVSILLERVRTLSTQFGFTVSYSQLNKMIGDWD